MSQARVSVMYREQSAGSRGRNRFIRLHLRSLACLLFGASRLVAQDSRFGQPQLLLGHLADVNDFAVLDLNRDGLPDLVCTMGQAGGTSSCHGLRTMLRQDNGGFEPGPVLRGELGNLAAILAADFTRDGIPDLVVSRLPGEAPGVFLIPGVLDDRYFADPVPVTGIVGPVRGFRLMDLEGDQDADLLVMGDSLLALETLNEGGLGVPYVVVDHPVPDACAADFDGDGDTDLIACVSRALVQFRNEGDGVLVRSDDLELEECGLLCAVDADGDGDPDLVVAAGGGIRVFWNGPQPFPSWDHTDLAGIVAVPDALIGCDLDGDGTQEILFAEALANRFGYWRFEPMSDPPVGTAQVLLPMDYAQDLKLQDLSGDGLPDLLLVSRNHGRLDLCTALGPTGGFAPATNLLAGARFWQHEVVPADLDLDGDADLVAVSSASSTRRSQQVFENLGGGEVLRLVAEFKPDPPVISLPTIGDFNGDGLPDIASHMGTQYGGTTEWRRNLGQMRFADEPHWVGSGYGVTDMQAADLDADGRLDLLQSAFAPNAHVVYRNTGNGFTQCLMQNSSPGVRRVGSGDLDGDGDMDILTQSWFSDPGFRWFEVVGSICDSESRTFAWQTGHLDWFAVVDLDQDGAMDIVPARVQDGIGWLRNVAGDGSEFDLIRLGEVTLGCVLYQCLDLDGDQNPDLLGWNSDNGNIFWLENRAGDARDWAEHVLVEACAELQFMCAADMDGDGDPDVLYGESRHHQTFWLENSTITEVEEHGARLAGPPPLSCMPNPFNGTCRLELQWHRAVEPRFRVFDLLGKQRAEIQGQRVDARSWVTTLEAGALSSGVYFVLAGNDGDWHTTRLVLAK